MNEENKTQNNLATLFPEIAQEWHPIKNGDLLPSEISPHSKKKVWWLLPYDDPVTGKHFDFEWEMPIDNRTTQNCMCPFLSGRAVWTGFNDLETRFPEIAQEWHPTKNGNLKPSQITYGNGKKVWWLYQFDDPKTGKHFNFEWESSVNYRTSTNSKCPFIIGTQIWKGYNDLATTNPDLAKEFHSEKNGKITTFNISEKSSKKVWWICNNHHEWQAQINLRARGAGCPYCAGIRIWKGYNDLQTLFPNICNEWDFERNNNSPDEVGAGSGKKVWWICENNHHYLSTPYNRINGIGCPYCSGRYAIKHKTDLATTNPVLANEWDYEKNGDLTPSDVKMHSSIKVWWKCDFGHEWQATINNRTYGRGCPFCSGKGTSIVEQGFAYYISQLYRIEQRKKIFDCEIDIYLSDYKIGIEYDGIFYHSSQKAKKREEKKNTILNENNIELYRIKETKDHNEIVENTIYYIADYMGNNYIWALNELLRILSKKTGITNTCEINISHDIVSIRERYDLLQIENSVEKLFPMLVSEWHPQKNGKLKPYMISVGSRQKVWWKCKYGHEWQAQVNSRARTRNATRCPYCSGFKVIAGTNDLATIHPNLIKEWDFQMNSFLPSEISPASNRKFWWKCSLGHSFQATPNARLRGDNCPICSNHRVLTGYNDLLTKYPEISKEWNQDKNNPLKPSDILFGSHTKVWWTCPNNHSYYASVGRRTRAKTGCPICAGKKILYGYNDLYSQRPDIAKEWNYDKNVNLNPKELGIASNKQVWWKCKLGHEWKTGINHRTLDNNGCPYCAGQKTIIGLNDLLSVNPKLASEWNYEKNGELTPSMVMPKSGKRVWWKCPICQYEWDSTIVNRTIRMSGCPKCKHKWSET